VNNNDGTYTYTNEEGVSVTIDIPAGVINNIEEILGDTNVLNELIEVLGDTYVGGNVYYDGTQFTYVDQAGDTHVITFEDIVQATETITKVVDNTDGTYTYINEDEKEFVISIPASIVESFETIVNSGPVIVGGEEYTTIEEYIEYIANASVTVEGGDFITVTGDGTSGNPYKVEIKEGAPDSML